MCSAQAGVLAVIPMWNNGSLFIMEVPCHVAAFLTCAGQAQAFCRINGDCLSAKS